MNKISNKIYLVLDGSVCSVVWFQHHKPGKGGAFMKVKAKNVTTGQIVEKTFRASEKVTQAIVEKKNMQFLYLDVDSLVFMDVNDYSQLSISASQIGDNINFLIEGNEVDLVMYGSEILDVELPPKIKMKVTKADPGIKGNTVSGGTKRVKLETGLEIDVPLFINEGENIIVDTRTGDYISRTE